MEQQRSMAVFETHMRYPSGNGDEETKGYGRSKPHLKDGLRFTYQSMLVIY